MTAAARCPRRRARRVVVRPVDGDTIVVDIDGPGGVGAVHRHRHPGVGGPGPPGRVLRAGGQGAHRRAAPGGHASCASSATSRPATATTACSPTCIRDADDVLVNLLARGGGLRRGPLAYPPNVARQGELDRAEAEARADRPGPLARLRGHRRADRARGSVSAVTSLAERLGYGARRPPADHQLRRPRLLPRRQRRHLRGPPRRHRHQRHADGAVPLGPRRGVALPRRGRRRAPHAQRRVRPLPLGADHPRAVAARRRRRLPPHGHRRVGPRRPRRGAPRAPGPGRAGDPLGLRRQPPRQPHGHAAAAARVLRRLPRAGRRVRAPAAPVGRLERADRSGSRSAGWPPRRACCSPTTSSWSRRRRVPAHDRDGRRTTCARASPRSTSTPRSTPPSCGRSPTTGPAGSTTTTLVTRDHSLRQMLDRAGVHRIGYRPLRDLQRAA